MQTLKRKVVQSITIITASMILTTAIPEPVIVDAKAKCVYVTKTGKRYHSTKKCRGLNNANSIKKVKLKKLRKMIIHLAKYVMVQNR